MEQHRSHKGVSLIEVVVMVAVFGIMALFIPVTLRLINNLKHQQQIAQINTEARHFIRQLMHEVRSAKHVDVLPNLNFVSNRQVTECLSIHGYDLNRYRSATGTFEETNMFKNIENGFPNLTRTFYCVYQEIPGAHDFNNNGNHNETYILKIILTPEHTAIAEPPLATASFTLINAIKPGELIDEDLKFSSFRAQTYFENMIELDPNPNIRMFGNEPGTREIVKTELRIHPSFYRANDPPRIYFGMATMRNQNRDF